MKFGLDSVTVTYNGMHVLKDVSAELDGTVVTVVRGVSGAGKSTMLQLLHADMFPTSGNVTIDGVNTMRMRSAARRQHRRVVGLVLQHSQLVSALTVSQNVQAIYAQRGLAKEQAVRNTLELLAELGLSHCREKLPHQLSGGERQLTSLARAIALEPQVLLADEPTSMLDAEMQVRIATAINARIGRGMGLILCTHHESFTRLLPDHRKVWITNGMLELTDPTAV